MRAFGAQWRAELAMSLRQGEQMLVAIGIPVLILVFFSIVDILPERPDVAGADQRPKPVDSLAPAVLALAIMSTAMVSLGIGTGFERYYKVLKRLGVTPLGRPRLIGAKIGDGAGPRGAAAGASCCPSPPPSAGTRADDVVLVVPAYVLGTAAFAGIGLLMAGTLKGTAEPGRLQRPLPRAAALRRHRHPPREAARPLPDHRRRAPLRRAQRRPPQRPHPGADVIGHAWLVLDHLGHRHACPRHPLLPLGMR